MHDVGFDGQFLDTNQKHNHERKNWQIELYENENILLFVKKSNKENISNPIFDKRLIYTIYNHVVKHNSWKKN